MNNKGENESGDSTNGGKGMEKIRVEQHSTVGLLWFGAWLFTIGFLHVSFWKGVLAILIWPYYLGAHFSLLGR